jgi:hypothetical protein
VADVDDRLAPAAPGVDQRDDVVLARRVVARAPDGVAERLLDVHDDQGLGHVRILARAARARQSVS